MKIDRGNLRHWLLLIQQGIYTWIAILLRPFLRRSATPVTLLYGHQFAGNLKSIYREWERGPGKGLTCYYLTLDPEHAVDLELAGVNVLRCNRLCDMLVIGRASAMITDHGLHAMTPLLALTDIRFIDVWHGIPFKGFVPEDFKLQRRYDEVWVSSPLLKKIYVEKFGFRSDRVIDLGYARTDRLFERPLSASSFREREKIRDGNRIVLYAPTWQQDDDGRELFPFGEQAGSFIGALDRLCGEHDATLVIRSHLNAGITRRSFPHTRYCSQRDYPDTEDLLLGTDILICDWSSIAFDFLALERPTIFLDVSPPFRHGFTLGREFRFGDIVANMVTLESVLVNIFENPDSHARMHSRRRQEVCSAVYGSNRDGKTSARQLKHLHDPGPRPDQ